MADSKCTHCGQPLRESERRCPSCLYAPVPFQLHLRSENTGKTVTFKTAMEVGRAGLAGLADPDLTFCENGFQFRLSLSLEAGGWIVYPNPNATNPTWLNGSSLPETGAVLQAGDVLSIKGKRLLLSIDL
jgi:hypothetical protein